MMRILTLLPRYRVQFLTYTRITLEINTPKPKFMSFKLDLDIEIRECYVIEEERETESMLIGISFVSF